MDFKFNFVYICYRLNYKILTMKKEVIIAVLEDISKDMERDLIETDEMWMERVDHARIIGFLEESLRCAKRRIDKIYEK